MMLRLHPFTLTDCFVFVLPRDVTGEFELTDTKLLQNQ